MNKLWRILLKLSWLFYSLVLLVVLSLIGFALIQNAPEIKRLEQVEVKASRQGSVLGWRELGQIRGLNSAAKAHLKARYEAENGGWLLQNVAMKRKVDTQTNLIDTRYIRRWSLQTGDKLHFNHFSLNVNQADGTQLVLTNPSTNTVGHWDGYELLLNKTSGYASCERRGLRNLFGRISDTLHWWMRDSNPQNALRLFSLGGQVHCTTRWPHKKVATSEEQMQPDSIRFYWHRGQFQIGLGSEASHVLIERDGKKQALKALDLKLRSEKDGIVQRLILGRTHYTVAATEDLLVLKPIANQPIFLEERPQLDNPLAIEAAEEFAKKQAEQLREMQRQGIVPVYTQHDWIGASQKANPLRSSSLLVLSLLVIGGLLLAVLMRMASRHSHQRGKSFLLYALLLWSVLLPMWLSHAWSGQLGVMLILLSLSSIWVSLVLFGRGYLSGLSGRLWFMVLALSGIGALVLTQLAAGADNTRWIKYASGHLFTLTVMTSMIGVLALFPRQILEAVWYWLSYGKTRLVRYLRFSIVLAVLFLLGMQFAIGTEQGIWGIQPVELAKFMMIFISAFSLWQLYMLRATHSYAYLRNPRAFVLLFLWVLFAFVLVSLILAVGVHDYSPTLIVAALLGVYLWSAIPHPSQNRERLQAYTTWTKRGVLIILPLTLLFALAVYFYISPPGYNDVIPQAERLRIWSDPLRYPEAASQLLNSLARVASGGWFGNGWFGGNGAVMTVPAVQDDFIAAFLLNRFGGLWGLILIMVQIFWLTTLFAIAKRLRESSGNMEVLASRFILSYVIFGLAWVHLLHWIISWGNVLGLLPIMGQPMTWLSAGNSHLLGIGVMTLGLGMLGGWMISKR